MSGQSASRPSRLGPQATQTFEKPRTELEAPAWLVLPILFWSRCQLAWLETAEAYLVR